MSVYMQKFIFSISIKNIMNFDLKSAGYLVFSTFCFICYLLIYVFYWITLRWYFFFCSYIYILNFQLKKINFIILRTSNFFILLVSLFINLNLSWIHFQHNNYINGCVKNKTIGYISCLKQLLHYTPYRILWKVYQLS